jgi:GNAT superfamily N-acetyltransferase
MHIQTDESRHEGPPSVDQQRDRCSATSRTAPPTCDLSRVGRAAGHRVPPGRRRWRLAARGRLPATLPLLGLDGGRGLLLEDLYVAAASRRRGVGRALVAAAIDRARERGARRIELDTNEATRGRVRAPAGAPACLSRANKNPHWWPDNSPRLGERGRAGSGADFCAPVKGHPGPGRGSSSCVVVAS